MHSNLTQATTAGLMAFGKRELFVLQRADGRFEVVESQGMRQTVACGPFDSAGEAHKERILYAMGAGRKG